MSEGCMELLLGSAAEAAGLRAEIKKLKKGKSDSQKLALDFLIDMPGCLSKINPKALNMQSYLAMVQQMCQSIDFRGRALEKIGLDPSQVQEIPPIVLNSFVYNDDCWIRADSNTAVSSQYSIAYIFFSATQMYTYEYVFDTTSDNIREITNDFFYSDITCFNTKHEVREKIDVKLKKGCNPKGCLNMETITKNHYVVDTLEIIVPGASYTFSLRNSDTVEQSIQAAKAMLREKKYK